MLRRLGARGDYVEVSPEDARAREIGSNDLVEVVSARARITLRAFVTRSVRPGELFIPMHGPAINKLTFAAFDPAFSAAGVQGLRGGAATPDAGLSRRRGPQSWGSGKIIGAHRRRVGERCCG